MKPKKPPAAEEVDPDVQDLPPHITVPVAAVYKRDQLRARFVVSVAAVALLLVLAFVIKDQRFLYGLCAAGTSLAALVLGLRYLLAHREAKSQEKTQNRLG